MTENGTTTTTPTTGTPYPSETTQPARIQVGGLVLLAVDALAAEWGLPPEGFERLLATLKIPKIHFPGGERRYLSLYSLEYSLFVLGLPHAMRKGQDPNQKDTTVTDVHFQMAGLLYGTLTIEAVRERVRALAKALGKDQEPARKRSKAARDGRNKVGGS